jgi:hypothetical protein
MRRALLALLAWPSGVNAGRALFNVEVRRVG